MLTNRPHSETSIHGAPIVLSGLLRAPLRLLHLLWRDRWLAVTSLVGIATISGLLVAVAMPRGPITANQALTLMLAGLVIGVVAGMLLRSRWAMLLAPITFVAVFELGRLNTDGPLVDGLRFDSSYGILAFILGRGFFGLIGLLPMVLGVSFGVGLARWLQRKSVHRPSRRQRLGLYARRGVGGLTTVGLVMLAVLISLPASTPAIVGADGKPLAGSIAELTQIPLGGHDQWLMIRGASVDNPVMLWLSGGPGQSDLAFTRALFADLQQDFVFVDWDQRGTGKSRPALDPAATWTLDQAVADTIELTNYLRERFDEEKIYLVGESWGTTLGVLAVQRHPELYHAFIGSGQMVSQRATDHQIYEDLLTYAAETGDAGLAETLRGFGEPPYDDVFASAFVMQQYALLETDYDPPQAYLDRGTAAGLGPWGILASEYAFVEKVNVLGGMVDMFAVMYPQLQEIDFRRDVPTLEVPIYLLQGEFELQARDELAREWFAQVQAPRKELFTIEQAGHSTALEGFEEFHRIMTEIVVPETYPSAAA